MWNVELSSSSSLYEPCGSVWPFELLAVGHQVNREVVVDVRRQDGEVVPRDAVLARRVGLADAPDVRRSRLSGDVHMTARVLSERRRVARVEPGQGVALHVGDREHVRVDIPVAVVAVDVLAEEALHLLVADDVAAGDRARVPRRVRVLEDGRDDAGVGRVAVRVAGAVDVASFEAAPAEIDASSPAGVDGPVIELLPGVLADVAEIQVAQSRVRRSRGSPRSNEKRHGFRSPYDQISGRAPDTPTKGLFDGTV